MKLSQFRVLSFDCYGTLIDWETGIWNALQPLLGESSITREQALADYGEVEPEQEHLHPKLLYRDLLARVHAELASKWRLPSDAAMHEAFGASVGAWPPFADTQAALEYLSRHFRLVILSNVDRQSFAATAAHLGVRFDAVCTAEEIGSYKPDPRNFDFLKQRVRGLGFEPAQLLHVAQSLFHDIGPAEAAGIARCWIDRRRGKAGAGATKPVAQMPSIDFCFASLEELAEAHRSG